MKKTIAVLFLTALLFMTACNKPITIPDGAAHANLSGADTVYASFAHPSKFEKGGLISEPDMIIADVTINGFLDEYNADSFYSATVNQLIYGDVKLNERIVISVFGSSQIKAPANEMPPLEAGERLIMFGSEEKQVYLPTEELWREDHNYDLPEWFKEGYVFGSTTYCPVVEYEDELYVANFNEHLTEYVEDRAVEKQIQAAVTSKLHATLTDQVGVPFRTVYTYETFLSMIDEFAPKK